MQARTFTNMSAIELEDMQIPGAKSYFLVLTIRNRGTQSRL